MKLTTTVHYSESDVFDLIRKNLKDNGLILEGDLDLLIRPKTSIPDGATAGDQIGIIAKVIAINPVS